MEKQEAVGIIKDVTKEAEEIVQDYVTNEHSSALAVASAFLGVAVRLYKAVLGAEGTAVMIYKVADDLVLEVPIEKTFPDGVPTRKKRRRNKK